MTKLAKQIKWLDNKFKYVIQYNNNVDYWTWDFKENKWVNKNDKTSDRTN